MAVRCANCIDGYYFEWVHDEEYGPLYLRQECEVCYGMGRVSKVYPPMQGLIIITNRVISERVVTMLDLPDPPDPLERWEYE